MQESLRRIEAASNIIRFPPPGVRLALAGADHPQRPALEAFVGEAFLQAYGARVDCPHPLIAGLIAGDGVTVAAAGLRFAEQEPLFLETYLDAPVETEVGRLFDCSARRADIVEIGAFASSSVACTLRLFEILPRWLAEAAGRGFAVATLRPDLARMLARCGFALLPLAHADPARLGEGAWTWGSYYAGAPRVYAGRIAAGASLSNLRDRLQARTDLLNARRARASA